MRWVIRSVSGGIGTKGNLRPAQRAWARHHTRSRLPTAAFILFALMGVAQARWKSEYGDASPEIQAWYGQQYNGQHQWCCDKSDGHPYFDDYGFNPDGSVTLTLNGKQHTLPKYMVLSGINPTGHAVWWYVETEAYGHVDYCFAPGTLG